MHYPHIYKLLILVLCLVMAIKEYGEGRREAAILWLIFGSVETTGVNVDLFLLDIK